MSFDVFNKAIGMLDADIIEAAEKAPAQAKPARVAAFAKRPWVKWVAAAAAIVVFAVGTPIALNMMGAFGGGNYVPPSGGESGNSGVVTPIDGSEQDSDSEQSSQLASNSQDAEPSSNSSETPQSSGRQGISSSSAETPDVSSSGTPDDVPEQPEGEFVKDNMPAVTYKINGEYKTFDYQSSTAVVDSGSSYVIDHYVGSDGSTVSADAASGGLVRYEIGSSSEGNPSVIADDPISETQVLEIANGIVANTNIAFNEIESASVSVQYSDDRFFISLFAYEKRVEVCLNKMGELISIFLVFPMF